MQAATQRQMQNGPRATPPNLAPQVNPIPPISNRYNKLLEGRVTYTKQRTDANPNRYKNRVSPVTIVSGAGN